LLNLEAGDGDDVALFNEDEGDAKKNGAVMLACCSGFVTVVVFTADAAAAEGGIDTLPNAPLVEVGIDTLPNAPLVEIGIPVLLEAVLLEAVLLEAVLLEAVLLEAVLLEAVGVCPSAETVARIPVFPGVAVG
jgi:hypothetical protein